MWGNCCRISVNCFSLEIFYVLGVCVDWVSLGIWRGIYTILNSSFCCSADSEWNTECPFVFIIEETLSNYFFKDS